MLYCCVCVRVLFLFLRVCCQSDSNLADDEKAEKEFGLKRKYTVSFLALLVKVASSRKPLPY